MYKKTKSDPQNLQEFMSLARRYPEWRRALQCAVLAAGGNYHSMCQRRTAARELAYLRRIIFVQQRHDGVPRTRAIRENGLRAYRLMMSAAFEGGLLTTSIPCCY